MIYFRCGLFWQPCNTIPQRCCVLMSLYFTVTPDQVTSSSGDGIFSALELNWHKWRQHYHRGRGGGHPEVIKQFMDAHHLITTLFEVGILRLEQTFPVPQILYRPNCCTWAFWLAFLIHTRFHVKGTWPVRCQTLNWWHWWNFPTWTQMVWWV